MDPLDGTNFPTWKVQMRMVLMKLGVWRIVEGTEAAPEINDGVAYRKYSERKDKALATIVLAIKTNLLYLIGDPQDPVEVWNKLSNQFQKKTWANKLALRRKLHGLRLKDQEPVQEHIKAMVEVFDELAVIGEAIDEEDRVVQILASLPDSYGMLVTALEANTEVPKLELVTERLLNEERKMKEKASSSSNNNSFPGNYNSGENALLASNRFKNFQRTCYYCGKSGHIKAFCDELKKKNEEQQQQAQEENRRSERANFSYCPQRPDDNSDNDEYECIALISEVVKKASSKWIVDSAAGSHLCQDKNKMRNLKKLKQSKRVKVGNGQYVDANHEGTVKLKIKAGSKVRNVKLQNVLFVPELIKYNLFSVSKAAELGKRIVFGKNGCSIIDLSTGKLIGSASRIGKLYYIDECINREEKPAKDALCVRDMKKALHSVKENNFRKDMMTRLNSIEEDKINMNMRPVEEEMESESYTFKEENIIINVGKTELKENEGREKCFQEDMHENRDIQEVDRNEFTEDIRQSKDIETSTREVKNSQSCQSQEDRTSSFQVQSCCANTLVSNEMSITNRHNYLMRLLFKEFPVSSIAGREMMDNLD